MSARTLPAPTEGSWSTSHQDEPHPVRHGLEQVVHEQDVDHGALVHDQDIPIEGVVLVFLIAFRRLHLQQAVDSLGLHPGRLGQAFRRPPRRGRQENAGARLPEGRDDAAGRGGLARPGPAGQYQDLAGRSRLDGLFLDLVVEDPR